MSGERDTKWSDERQHRLLNGLMVKRNKEVAGTGRYISDNGRFGGRGGSTNAVERVAYQ